MLTFLHRYANPVGASAFAGDGDDALKHSVTFSSEAGNIFRLRLISSTLILAWTSFACSHTAEESPPIAARDAPREASRAWASCVALLDTKGEDKWDKIAAEPDCAFPDGALQAVLAQVAATEAQTARARMWLSLAVEHGWGNLRAITEAPIWTNTLTDVEVDQVRQKIAARSQAQNYAPDCANGGANSQICGVIERARASGTSSLRISRNGAAVVAIDFDGSDRAVELMSATKTFAALAIGILLQDGRIGSIDEPISSYYTDRPDWQAPPKNRITLRHILSQTSGLQAPADDRELTQEHDALDWALNAPVIHEPGTVYFYNNRAMAIIAGLVERASGKPIDELIRSELFLPLGINHYLWNRDPSGRPYVFYGLEMASASLSSVGNLLLDGGAHRGRQLLQRDFVEHLGVASSPMATYGLLTWVHYSATTRKIPAGLLEDARIEADLGPETTIALQPYVGQPMSLPKFRETLIATVGDERRKALYRAVASAGRTLVDEGDGIPIGYSASGTWGNYLVICPRTGIVASRTVERSYTRPHDELFYSDFPREVCSLD
ncbi:MAG: serine hydrolase domain-containing protein [Deltaproteobacteria bacterium]|nr:serine hydrolase domain-containing protein [Deltaproteobacteria bacterium]